MEDRTNKTSKVPAHLRHFHRSTFTIAPANPSSSISNLQSSGPELCPPHWRLDGRDRSLRARLKALVRKDWPALITQQTFHNSAQDRTEERPTIMRMKDSEDYITARGANPRTGLISPSVGTRTPCTPNSPGEALKRHSGEQQSPTPAQKERPMLCRANEGRKISSGNAPVRSAVDKTKEADHVPGTFPENHAQDTNSQCETDHVALRDDQFVVNMPSAREPQPFRYPGYTAEQIDALEHYRRKARRISSDGYDRRLFHAQPSCKTYTDYHECACEDEHVTASPSSLHDRRFIPYNDRAHEPVEPPRLTVRKRGNARSTRMTHHNADELSRVPDDDHAATRNDDTDPLLLLPPSTSKTSPINDSQGQDAMRTGSVVRSTKHAEKQHSATVIVDRKILQNFKSHPDSAPRRKTVANGDQYYSDKSGVLPRCQPPEGAQQQKHTYTNLSKLLPRVRLVKPEDAAVPKAQRERTAANPGDKRQCSFGCRRAAINGECAETRKVSDTTVVRQSSDLFHSSQPCCPEQNPDKAEILLEFATSTLRYFGSLQVPRIDTLEVLKDPDVPTKEKVEALKTVLSLAGHALAICTLLAMLWKVGAAVMHLLEVVFWPLAVPLKMLRWISGLG